PKLWEKYHDDKRLILRQADYKKPEDSLLMKEGLKSKDSHVKDLAALLTEACSLEPLKIRAIEKLESSKSIMDWIIPPIKTAPDQNYSSIIQKVVSLSEEDMSNFENNKISIVTSESEKSKEADKETKPRKDADGSWGFIGSLLFEEVDDEKTSNNDSDKGTIGKLKKTLFGLIFEDDDDENQQAPVANAPNNNLVQPEKDSSDKENSNKNQEKPPIVQTIKEEKEDKTKQDNSISSLKDKTAPLPDWLKKRKEKEF
ncbi:MAG: hypothetical protein OEV44_05825, partial [Spirochaetota bacterium]|nr:hypothetical protein [Spirochaetota bacterium]